MRYLFTFLVASLLFITACKSTKEVSSSAETVVANAEVVEKWIVAPEKIACDDTNTNLCYQVKKAGETNYSNYDVVIEGFTFEPGYKYLLEVKVITSKKADTRYVLVKETYKVAG